MIAKYEDATGRKFEETFLIGYAAFENLSRVGDAPLHTIAKSIKELQQSIRNLSNGMNKLSVVVYSQDDLDAESSDVYHQTGVRRLKIWLSKRSVG